MSHDVPPVANDSLLNASAQTAGTIIDPVPGELPLQRIFIDMLDRQFYLREVHVQADTILTEHWNLSDYDNMTAQSGAAPRTSLHDLFAKKSAGSNFNDPYRWAFTPNFPTIRVYKVHRRNMYGQVIDESDSRHLHTLYEYLPGQYYKLF